LVGFPFSSSFDLVKVSIAFDSSKRQKKKSKKESQKGSYKLGERQFAWILVSLS
jgi:hypothetical protein